MVHRHGGVASASQSVDLSSKVVESHQKTLKMVFTNFLIDAQHETGSMKQKSGSLLVVFLVDVLNGISSSLCGIRVVFGRRIVKEIG